MASVFTYETDPVRVASPWPRAPTVGRETTTTRGRRQPDSAVPPAEALADYDISRLIPEPQDGPVEYKLHLLLRPRRTFSATSTVQKVSGSYLSKSRGPSSASEPLVKSGPSTPMLAPSIISRQNRLQHLTTQLLWRLQQSSPYHTPSRSDLILPVLPGLEVHTLESTTPRNHIAGLEESLGALYEIGVSDDGSFVGLARDELDESLTVLRAMSHSLGCHVQVLRLVDVGSCQWTEDLEVSTEPSQRIREERLWVAEVLVGPDRELRNQAPKNGLSRRGNGLSDISPTALASNRESSNTADEQLRVTLTGSTTSGKSSLLGTLSTSTLDNGRGKSRLSLLKHRHEIVSGVTSSLAQELIGYQDVKTEDASRNGTSQVVNYASANVSSWNDIHNMAHPGRLVFVTDSAGHPRYRRTTVRGVISWAPHWTLCCVAADDKEDNTGKVGATASSSNILGTTGQGVDLSKAHLDLCLKLELPLVVVITKYDLASRSGLRQTLAKVLSTLKDAGRKPAMLPLDSPNDVHHSSMQNVAKADADVVRTALTSVPVEQRCLLVPIVLTSAVTGAGRSKLHSLLRHLPILPFIHTATSQTPKENLPLFHIDEVFSTAKRNDVEASRDFIVSGYLRRGSLAVGDHVLVGPFTAGTPNELIGEYGTQCASPILGPYRGSPSSLQQRPRSSPISVSNTRDLGGGLENERDTLNTWNRVAIASIRNLRLPVRRLYTGQVATIAINFLNLPTHAAKDADPTFGPSLRRGMVLLPAPSDQSDPPPAYRSFTAIFKEPNAYVIPGSSVTIYTASVRASAKIVEVRVPTTSITSSNGSDEIFKFDHDNDNNDDDGHYRHDGGDEEEEGASTLTESVSTLTDKETQLEAIEITFRFSSFREWMELDTQVLVTPASGLSMLNPLEQHGSESNIGGGGSSSSGSAAGLDGFVGKIVSAAV